MWAKDSCGGVVPFRSWAGFAFCLFFLYWISYAAFPGKYSCSIARSDLRSVAERSLHILALEQAVKARAKSWVAKLCSGGFQQQVSMSPGNIVDDGNYYKSVLTRTDPLNHCQNLNSRWPFATEVQGQHKVSVCCQIWWKSVKTHVKLVGSPSPESLLLLCPQSISQSATEERRQLVADRFSPAEPLKQLVASLSFRCCVGADI